MSKANILFITVRSDSGGGTKHLYDLSKNLDQVNIYIAAPWHGEYAKHYKELSEGFVSIPFRKFSLFALIKMILFVKSNSINVVHSHGRGAGIYSKLMAFFGIKVVHTLHGAHYPKSFKEKLIVLIEKILRHNVDQFIFVSESEKEISLALKVAHKSGEVIANGIEPNQFAKIESPQSQNILGTLSRLDPHKNNEELILFLKEMPSYQLRIAGDGLEMKYLKSIKTDNVSLLGHTKDIVDFFSKISVYVSASKGEGLPYSILEAIAANKRVLASNVAGHRDILPKENLYEQGSFEDFQKKIKTCKKVELKEIYTLKYSIEQTQKLLLTYA